MQIVKKVAIPIGFVIVACIVALVCVLSSYTTAYAVTINGEEVGIVKDEADITNAMNAVENRTRRILDDENYELSADVEYNSVYVKENKVTETSMDIQNALYDSLPEISKGFVINVDGENLGLADKDELNELIEDISSDYINENTVDVEVLSDVSVTYKFVPSDIETDLDKIEETLRTPIEPEITYEVQEEETLSDVVEKEEVSVEQVIDLNPELTENMNDEEVSAIIEELSDKEQAEETEIQDDIEETPIDSEENIEEEETPDIYLEEGTILTIEPEVARISIQTQDSEIHEENAQFEIEQIEDENLYVGESEVRTEGENGLAYVWENVTKINGEEVDREFDESVTVREPVNEVVAVGIKEQEATQEQTTAPESEPQTEEVESTTEEQLTQSGTAPDEAEIENNSYLITTTTTTTTTNNNSSNNNSSSGSTTSNNNSNTSSNNTTSSSSNENTSTADTSSNNDSYDYSYSSNNDLRYAVASYAQNFLGCSYVHGGHGPNVFDCSGLTAYVYQHFGYNLPWTVEGQYACGTYVPLDTSQMLPGDLIFWSYGGSTPTHVGMYIGNGQYIQATKPGDVVRINTVSSYAGQPLVGCRRIIQ